MLDADQLQQAAQAHAEQEGGTSDQVAYAPNEQVDSEDDEGAIQSYMERLLKRVASGGRDEPDPAPAPSTTAAQGTARSHAAAQSPPVVKSAAAPVQAAASQSLLADDELDNTDEPTSGDDDIWPGAADEPDQLLEAKQGATSLLDERSPNTSNEMAANLLAMRELANNSARQAIQSSDYRRHTALAVGQLAVASICVTASGVLISLTLEKPGAETVGGVIGLLFGSSMFLRGTVRILRSMRLKRQLGKNAKANDGVEVASDRPELDQE
jgi:hypothetical protein